MTSPSFCQTGIKTLSTNSDSTVCIPKKLGLYAIQDLIKYDCCKEENISLTNTLLYKESYIRIQDSIITLQKSNLNICEGELVACTVLNKSNSKTIEVLKSKVVRVKRQRNAVAVIATGLLIGLILK